MSSGPANSLAVRAAAAIAEAFDRYKQEFNRISRQAKVRFEKRDWQAAHQDALERLDLRDRAVAEVVTSVREQLGEVVSDRKVWAEMKIAFTRLIARRSYWQLAETFFNSATRRIFATVGVDPNIEFVATEWTARPAMPPRPISRTYRPRGSTVALLDSILADFPFAVPWRDRSDDLRLAAQKIDDYIAGSTSARPIDAIEMAWPVFFRNKGAYLVGRMLRGADVSPFILGLLNQEQGLELDALLLELNDASNIFSFTRSYFHVEMNQPIELIDFIKSIVPHKRISEIYISLGRHKHGKTELYRELLLHLGQASDSFVHARGDKGLVMVVFTLPSLDLVFKVIRDKFAPPKTNTKAEVKSKYALVFRQDRAGRLVDAQEFEHLTFNRSRFSPELLDELLTECADNVCAEGEQIHIRHLYVERRLVPLNIFIREANEASARAAIIDYGQSIRDLAATNTFPGDLLLKNFGVTRTGRVIFYDYDELCLVTDCNFRDIPPSGSDLEDLSAEPWFYVGERDVFPEEFLPFLGLSPPLKEAFLRAHRELLTPDFWRRMQELHRTGEIVHIFPYSAEKRLRRWWLIEESR